MKEVNLKKDTYYMIPMIWPQKMQNYGGKKKIKWFLGDVWGWSDGIGRAQRIFEQ